MSPFVFKGRLYRVESKNQKGCTDPKEERKHSFARIRDVEKDIILSEFAKGRYFFSAFSDGDRVFVLGTLNNSHDGRMGGDTVKVFESTDLVNWSERVLFKKEGWIFYNHAVVKTEDGYVITVEKTNLRKLRARSHLPLFSQGQRIWSAWNFLISGAHIPR